MFMCHTSRPRSKASTSPPRKTKSASRLAILARWCGVFDDNAVVAFPSSRHQDRARDRYIAGPHEHIRGGHHATINPDPGGLDQPPGVSARLNKPEADQQSDQCHPALKL